MQRPVRTPMLGIGCGNCGFRDLGALREVNFAAEHGIVFDSEAQRAHITLDHAAGAQFYATRGHDVALNLLPGSARRVP